MFARSLLARSCSLRLAQVYSRPLSSLRPAQPTRYAVPSYANSRWFSAEPALRTENRVNERSLPAPSGTCYLANIPYKVTAQELEDAFSEFGKVKSVSLLTTSTGLPKGTGFVQFETTAEAIKFVESCEDDPIFVLDRRLFVQHAEKRLDALEANPPCDTLCVPSFNEGSQAEVQSMFGSFSNRILQVRFFSKKVDGPKMAFIRFSSVDAATEAMDAFKSQNQNVRISYARQRRSSDSFISRRSESQDN